MFKRAIRAVVPAAWLSFVKMRVRWSLAFLQSPQSLLRFVCNVCGRRTSYPRDKMTREDATCLHCGSSVRFRSIVHALSVELFGRSLTIDEFPARPDLRGAGMSDWEGYASRLAKKLNYTNTYYHMEPLLDITSASLVESELYDFLIATEVFEHIAQPVERGFRNALQLLKPGGVFIFSVPYVAGETAEHFPELWRYTLGKENDTWILTNETEDGRRQRYDRLVFHGGPGTVVEMRLFGKDSLRRNFDEAGFAQAQPHEEEVEKFGIVWNPYVAEKARYRPFLYGLDAPPWSARKS